MHVKSSYPELPTCPDTNAYSFLFQRQDQAEWPDFTLTLDPKTGEKHSFRDFIKRVQYAATALATPTSQGGLGVSPENGDIIGIMSENCADYITLVHACLYIATPFALISSLSKPLELSHAFKLSKPTCLFVDGKLLPIVLPIAREFGISSEKIYILSGCTSGRKSLSQLIDETQTRAAEIIPVHHARKDTLAYLIYSSGTTGLPKAVMISHGGVIATICQFIMLGLIARKLQALGVPDSIPRALAFLPMHHAYGLFAYCWRPSLSPLTMIMMPQWDTDLALSLIPKYKITSITLVPAIVHQLVHHPKTVNTDLSSVVSLSSGAAHLPPQLREKLKTLAPTQTTFMEGYGMSECTLSAMTHPVSGMLDGTLDRKPGTAGTLVPGMEARILLDDNGTPNGPLAGPNQVGELWLRGPNLALGYWNNEEATKGTFVDGWLRTGDRFWVDEDEYFFFADRAKDTLKVSGNQVSPVEIENVLLMHPQKLVQDVTVAGVSGGRTSDEKVPRAWVVLSSEGKKLGVGKAVKVLDDWHKENLSKYKWLRGGIEVVKQIPKSPTGKVLRRELQERHERGVESKNVKTKL
ncbi:hypothetical protein APHAL10511_004201 [Amanita phalloides]|nr:hypothetical protein APHAL10511_004201 [Amanita phalloides]